MPTKGQILTPEQKEKKAINDKKYCEKNREKRKEWGRAQYLKDKENGMRWIAGRRVWGEKKKTVKKSEGTFVIAFD